MNPVSQNWTIPTTKKLPSSFITQLPNIISLTSQLSIFQPHPYQYTFNFPTCAPLSSQSKTFDGADYRHCPEKSLSGLKAHTINQFCPEPTNLEQYWIYIVGRLAIGSTSIDVPASS